MNGRAKKGNRQPRRKERKPAKAGKRKPRGRGRQAGNFISTNPRSGRRAPQTRTTGAGTIVSHTETYGINVTGSSAFAVNSTWAIQPGIASYSKGTPLGTWLPQIAGNFDNYEIMSLKFSYRAACSTLTPGLVAFGFEPNPESNAPTSFQELRNMRSVDGSVHANLDFDISKQVRRPLLTRKGIVVNLPSYDAGKVYFSSVGSTDGAQLGFVDVHYVVRLFNPQSANSSPGSAISYDALLPTQRWAGQLTGDQTNNCASASMAAFAKLLDTAAPSGAPLFEEFFMNSPTLSSTVDGCQFASTASVNVLRCKQSARYKVTFQVAADFQDLKLFCAQPFVSNLTTTTLFEPAQELILSDAATGAVSYVPTDPVLWRGFTGTVVGDPDPGTDLGIVGVWEIAIQAGQHLTIPIGVRTYNNVSTTTANITYRAGLGRSFVKLQYLGSL